MQRAIGYARVSTAGQAENGVSLEAQEARIKAWCLANGYDLAGFHVDAGLSGKRADNRPALQDSLRAAKKGDALVVYSLSRLARSTKDAIGIAEGLEKRGIDLVSLTERIDTTSATGRLFFRLMASLSEFERDLTAERTAAALAHKKAQGEVYGPIPFGYRETAGRLEEVEGEASIVAEIARRRATGESLRSIADDLNARGIGGKRGGKWHACTVAYIAKRAA